MFIGLYLFIYLFIWLFLLQAVKYPKNSYVFVQDVLGKKINNPLVQQYKQRCVYCELKCNWSAIEICKIMISLFQIWKCKAEVWQILLSFSKIRFPNSFLCLCFLLFWIQEGKQKISLKYYVNDWYLLSGPDFRGMILRKIKKLELLFTGMTVRPPLLLRKFLAWFWIIPEVSLKSLQVRLASQVSSLRVQNNSWW